MSGRNWQTWFLVAVALVAIVAIFFVPPIPQDPAYHNFADRRTFFGIPNFWNVSTNLPFILVGLYGLSKWSRLMHSSLYRLAYLVLCIGLIFVGFGSAYYHYFPTTETLVWDRLPMTVAFMAFFSMVLYDRISERLGRVMFLPLCVLGISSVAYWHWTETLGRGDLRPYGLIQFLPILLTLLMLIICKGKTLSTAWLWGTLGIYALAKVAEHFDKAVYNITGIISGHSIKHILASIAVLCIVLAALPLRDEDT